MINSVNFYEYKNTSCHLPKEVDVESEYRNSSFGFKTTGNDSMYGFWQWMFKQISSRFNNFANGCLEVSHKRCIPDVNSFSDWNQFNACFTHNIFNSVIVMGFLACKKCARLQKECEKSLELVSKIPLLGKKPKFTKEICQFEVL